jgi:hypothetical protein
MDGHIYALFGLAVRTELKLAGLTPTTDPGPGTPTVTVELATSVELERRFSGATNHRIRLSVGPSEAIDAVVGRDQDALMRYGDHALFLVSAGGAEVLCAPEDPESLAWRRVLLDTVLGTAARSRGLDGLHAGAVQLPGAVLAIAAPTGGGKSTLCAELVCRGARLLADDMVFLTRDRERFLAHPGPGLMNLPAGALPPGSIGERLAVFGEEEWIAVRHPAPAPAPLDGVILLERNRSAQAPLLEPDRSGTSLLEIALDSGPSPERRRARFDLLGDLSRAVKIMRLTAGCDEPPAALADLVESTVNVSRAGA